MGGWSTLRPDRFTPGKEKRYPLYRMIIGPQDRSGLVRKTSPAPEFDPRTFQAVASHYTNWAIHNILVRRTNKNANPSCMIKIADALVTSVKNKAFKEMKDETESGNWPNIEVDYFKFNPSIQTRITKELGEKSIFEEYGSELSRCNSIECRGISPDDCRKDRTTSGSRLLTPRPWNTQKAMSAIRPRL